MLLHTVSRKSIHYNDTLDIWCSHLDGAQSEPCHQEMVSYTTCEIRHVFVWKQLRRETQLLIWKCNLLINLYKI